MKGIWRIFIVIIRIVLCFDSVQHLFRFRLGLCQNLSAVAILVADMTPNTDWFIFLAAIQSVAILSLHFYFCFSNQLVVKDDGVSGILVRLLSVWLIPVWGLDVLQLLDLFIQWDWSTYLADYGQPNCKYLRVNPVTALTLLEKWVSSPVVYGTVWGIRMGAGRVSIKDYLPMKDILALVANSGLSHLPWQASLTLVA